MDAVYPAIVDVNPVPRASASNNWDAVIVNAQSLNGGYRSSHTNGNQTSYVEWRLPLEAGAWALEATYVKSDDAGIMTFSLDGTTDIGIARCLCAVDRAEHPRKHPGDQRRDTGMHTLRVRTDAKNIASSNYFGYLVWLRLVKQ